MAVCNSTYVTKLETTFGKGKQERERELATGVMTGWDHILIQENARLLKLLNYSFRRF